jgi:hypothetical protein
MTILACDAWTRTNNLLKWVEKEKEETARLTCRAITSGEVDITKLKDFVFDNYDYVAEKSYGAFEIDPYYVGDDQWGVSLVEGENIHDIPYEVIFNFTMTLKKF